MEARYIKAIIYRNSRVHWNDCSIDGVECPYSDEEIEYESNLSEWLRMLPCMDDDQNMILIIDLQDKKVINWDYNKKFSCSFKLCDEGAYQYLDEDKHLIKDEEYEYVPKELDFYNDSFGDYLILDIDENGNILI